MSRGESRRPAPGTAWRSCSRRRSTIAASLSRSPTRSSRRATCRARPASPARATIAPSIVSQTEKRRRRARFGDI